MLAGSVASAATSASVSVSVLAWSAAQPHSHHLGRRFGSLARHVVVGAVASQRLPLPCSLRKEMGITTPSTGSRLHVQSLLRPPCLRSRSFSSSIPVPTASGPQPAAGGGGSTSGSVVAPFRVDPTMGVKGRGLVATRSFAVGEEVLAEAPIAAIGDPAMQCNDVACTACFKALHGTPSHAASSSAPTHSDSDAKFKLQATEGSLDGHAATPSGNAVRCPGCGAPYCSQECRGKHWTSSHELLCNATPELTASCLETSSKSPLLISQMIARSLLHDFGGYWAQVENLCALPEEYDAGEELTAQWKHWYSVTRREISARVQGNVDAMFEQVFTYEFYECLMGILRLNSFRLPFPVDVPESSVPEHGADPVGGKALFIVASLLNHSCEPNLQYSFRQNGEIVLTARRDVEPEDELCISYIQEGLPVAERRALLSKWFGFRCDCPMCLREGEDL